MLAIDLISVIIVCICVGIIYTIFGYNVTELFTDGPNWKPWEQCLFWMFWPIVIPMFLIACTGLTFIAIIVGVFIVLITVYDFIKSLINKIIYR